MVASRSVSRPSLMNRLRGRTHYLSSSLIQTVAISIREGQIDSTFDFVFNNYNSLPLCIKFALSLLGFINTRKIIRSTYRIITKSNRKVEKRKKTEKLNETTYNL